MFLTLFFVLTGSALTPVSTKLDTTKIGVAAGDKKSWEIIKLTTTGEFDYLIGPSKKGDKISIEVVSVTLDSYNRITVKTKLPNGDVSEHPMGLDDIDDSKLIIFTDWGYWEAYAEMRNWDVVDGSGTFGRSYSSTQTYTESNRTLDRIDFFGDISQEEISESAEYDKSTGFLNKRSLTDKITYTNGNTSLLEYELGSPGSDDILLPSFEFTTIFITFSLIFIPIIHKRRN
ncbi:MAG: hypothetical protein HeimC2_31370 [Candidatus Heimdallarchaeota archaeon LC_2]|nr:MAG: hypothetical protein HeimC2_31370 [Candidatus Heimdallarchaeota archaeon LC_2]